MQWIFHIKERNCSIFMKPIFLNRRQKVRSSYKRHKFYFLTLACVEIVESETISGSIKPNALFSTQKFYVQNKFWILRSKRKDSAKGIFKSMAIITLKVNRKLMTKCGVFEVHVSHSSNRKARQKNNFQIKISYNFISKDSNKAHLILFFPMDDKEMRAKTT